MVLDATAWRPAIAGTFGIGTATFPVSSVHFGAVNGTLIDVSGVPYLYSGGTSVGVGNVSGYGMVLDATAWRPSVAGVFGIGTSSYPVRDIYFGTSTYIGYSGANLDFANTCGVVVGTATPGFGPQANNAQYLGGSALRWANTYSVLGNFSGAITWGAYAIPVPTGTTTTFLRNDGTWATPSGSGGTTQYTYTGTPTGGNNDIPGSINYSVTGNIVVLEFTTAIGMTTSSATTFTITGGTAAMRPAAGKTKVCVVQVLVGGALQLGIAQIGDDGVITLYSDGSNAVWPTSGSKAVNTCSISYTIT
jgi:hypothetical protein